MKTSIERPALSEPQSLVESSLPPLPTMCSQHIPEGEEVMAYSSRTLPLSYAEQYLLTRFWLENDEMTAEGDDTQQLSFEPVLLPEHALNHLLELIHSNCRVVSKDLKMSFVLGSIEQLIAQMQWWREEGTAMPLLGGPVLAGSSVSSLLGRQFMADFLLSHRSEDKPVELIELQLIEANLLAYQGDEFSKDFDLQFKVFARGESNEPQRRAIAARRVKRAANELIALFEMTLAGQLGLTPDRAKATIDSSFYVNHYCRPNRRKKSNRKSLAVNSFLAYFCNTTSKVLRGQWSLDITCVGLLPCDNLCTFDTLAILLSCGRLPMLVARDGKLKRALRHHLTHQVFVEHLDLVNSAGWIKILMKFVEKDGFTLQCTLDASCAKRLGKAGQSGEKLEKLFNRIRSKLTTSGARVKGENLPFALLFAICQRLYTQSQQKLAATIWQNSSLLWQQEQPPSLPASTSIMPNCNLLRQCSALPFSICLALFQLLAFLRLAFPLVKTPYMPKAEITFYGSAHEVIRLKLDEVSSLLLEGEPLAVLKQLLSELEQLPLDIIQQVALLYRDMTLPFGFLGERQCALVPFLNQQGWQDLQSFSVQLLAHLPLLALDLLKLANMSLSHLALLAPLQLLAYDPTPTANWLIRLLPAAISACSSLELQSSLFARAAEALISIVPKAYWDPLNSRLLGYMPHFSWVLLLLRSPFASLHKQALWLCNGNVAGVSRKKCGQLLQAAADARLLPQFFCILNSFLSAGAQLFWFIKSYHALALAKELAPPMLWLALAQFAHKLLQVKIEAKSLPKKLIVSLVENMHAMQKAELAQQLQALALAKQVHLLCYAAVKQPQNWSRFFSKSLILLGQHVLRDQQQGLAAEEGYPLLALDALTGFFAGPLELSFTCLAPQASEMYSSALERALCHQLTAKSSELSLAFLQWRAHQIHLSKEKFSQCWSAICLAIINTESVATAIYNTLAELLLNWLKDIPGSYPFSSELSQVCCVLVVLLDQIDLPIRHELKKKLQHYGLRPLTAAEQKHYLRLTTLERFTARLAQNPGDEKLPQILSQLWALQMPVDEITPLLESWLKLIAEQPLSEQSPLWQRALQLVAQQPALAQDQGIWLLFLPYIAQHMLCKEISFSSETLEFLAAWLLGIIAPEDSPAEGHPTKVLSEQTLGLASRSLLSALQRLPLPTVQKIGISRHRQLLQLLHSFEGSPIYFEFYAWVLSTKVFQTIEPSEWKTILSSGSKLLSVKKSEEKTFLAICALCRIAIAKECYMGQELVGLVMAIIVAAAKEKKPLACDLAQLLCSYLEGHIWQISSRQGRPGLIDLLDALQALCQGERAPTKGAMGSYVEVLIMLQMRLWLACQHRPTSAHIAGIWLLFHPLGSAAKQILQNFCLQTEDKPSLADYVLQPLTTGAMTKENCQYSKENFELHQALLQLVFAISWPQQAQLLLDYACYLAKCPIKMALLSLYVLRRLHHAAVEDEYPMRLQLPVDSGKSCEEVAKEWDLDQTRLQGCYQQLCQNIIKQSCSQVALPIASLYALVLAKSSELRLWLTLFSWGVEGKNSNLLEQTWHHFCQIAASHSLLSPIASQVALWQTIFKAFGLMPPTIFQQWIAQHQEQLGVSLPSCFAKAEIKEQIEAYIALTRLILERQLPHLCPNKADENAEQRILFTASLDDSTTANAHASSAIAENSATLWHPFQIGPEEERKKQQHLCEQQLNGYLDELHRLAKEKYISLNTYLPLFETLCHSPHIHFISGVKLMVAINGQLKKHKVKPCSEWQKFAVEMLNATAFPFPMKGLAKAVIEQRLCHIVKDLFALAWSPSEFVGLFSAALNHPSVTVVSELLIQLAEELHKRLNVKKGRYVKGHAQQLRLDKALNQALSMLINYIINKFDGSNFLRPLAIQLWLFADYFEKIISSEASNSIVIHPEPFKEILVSLFHLKEPSVQSMQTTLNGWVRIIKRLTLTTEQAWTFYTHYLQNIVAYIDMLPLSHFVGKSEEAQQDAADTSAALSVSQIVNLAKLFEKYQKKFGESVHRSDAKMGFVLEAQFQVKVIEALSTLPADFFASSHKLALWRYIVQQRLLADNNQLCVIPANLSNALISFLFSPLVFVEDGKVEEFFDFVRGFVMRLHSTQNLSSHKFHELGMIALSVAVLYKARFTHHISTDTIDLFLERLISLRSKVAVQYAAEILLYYSSFHFPTLLNDLHGETWLQKSFYTIFLHLNTLTEGVEFFESVEYVVRHLAAVPRTLKMVYHLILECYLLAFPYYQRELLPPLQNKLSTLSQQIGLSPPYCESVSLLMGMNLELLHFLTIEQMCSQLSDIIDLLLRARELPIVFYIHDWLQQITHLFGGEWEKKYVLIGKILAATKAGATEQHDTLWGICYSEFTNEVPPEPAEGYYAILNIFHSYPNSLEA